MKTKKAAKVVLVQSEPREIRSMVDEAMLHSTYLKTALDMIDTLILEDDEDPVAFQTKLQVLQQAMRLNRDKLDGLLERAHSSLFEAEGRA